MSREERLRKALEASLKPMSLEIKNESHLHAHHAGSPGTGESHYRVTIVAEAFTGRSRLERHRLVNAACADEIAAGLHALAIHAHAPDAGA